jgi:hypothetical protein
MPIVTTNPPITSLLPIILSNHTEYSFCFLIIQIGFKLIMFQTTGYEENSDYPFTFKLPYRIFPD